jgi:hypothetical protein
MAFLRPLRTWAFASAVAAVAFATVPAFTGDPLIIYKQEHVTNGTLDLTWVNGFGVSNNMQPATLDPTHLAYANPSMDHTVGVATNSHAPDSGGVILTAIDPEGISDYSWEMKFFTGNGNTRRGLVVRADPTEVDFGGLPSRFTSSYQLVIQSGLFQINFRRVVNGAPTTLRTWFATVIPGGLPQNTWHSMRIEAVGSQFRCWIDDTELTALENTPPVDDATLPTGWAGVYNFSASTGNVPFYVDDLVLQQPGPTPAMAGSWSGVKLRWLR